MGQGSEGVRIAAVAVLAVVVGLTVGIALGGNGDDSPQPVAAAPEVVTHTRTLTRTRTVTVTEPVDTVEDFSTGTTDDLGDTTTTSADGCDPSYEGACVPDDGQDHDCSEIAETDFDSVADDPDNLDPDGDGIACEPA